MYRSTARYKPRRTKIGTLVNSAIRYSHGVAARPSSGAVPCFSAMAVQSAAGMQTASAANLIARLRDLGYAASLRTSLSSNLEGKVDLVTSGRTHWRFDAMPSIVCPRFDTDRRGILHGRGAFRTRPSRNWPSRADFSRGLAESHRTQTSGLQILQRPDRRGSDGAYHFNSSRTTYSHSSSGTSVLHSRRRKATQRRVTARAIM